jgi:hypothetical protein
VVLEPAAMETAMRNCQLRWHPPIVFWPQEWRLLFTAHACTPRDAWFVRCRLIGATFARKVPTIAALVAPHLAMNFSFRAADLRHLFYGRLGLRQRPEGRPR